jgi:hypothetical protein
MAGLSSVIFRPSLQMSGTNILGSRMRYASFLMACSRYASEKWLTDLVNSKLRQVPDNQEVYIDKDGFTSIIFDITERVGSKGSGPEIDGRAMTTHLEELVGDDLDRVKVWNTTPTLFSRLEYVFPGAPLPFLKGFENEKPQQLC